jgi:phage gp46-like protein
MDAALIKNSDGDFTIGIENGDLKIENDFDTMINLYLFSDMRAPSDLISVPENRRGWPGDLVSPVNGRKFGSLLWLVEQKKLTPNTLNATVNYAQLALRPIVSDNQAKNIKVLGIIVPRFGIQLEIIITATNGEITTHYIKLWEQTGVN